MTSTGWLSTALVLLTGGLAIVGWAVRRQVTRNDTITATLAEHTAAIAQIATSLAHIATSQTRLLDDIEELDDAVDQLQLATTVLRERLGAHDEYRSARAALVEETPA